MNDDMIVRIFNTSFVEQDGLENTPEYAAWIAVHLTILALPFDEEISAECIALTAEVLMEVEPLYLEWALQRARRECATFPKPVEIFDFLREIPGWGEAND